MMFVATQKVSKGLLQLTKLKLISWILFLRVYCCHSVTAEAAALKQKKGCCIIPSLNLCL